MLKRKGNKEGHILHASIVQDHNLERFISRQNYHSAGTATMPGFILSQILNPCQDSSLADAYPRLVKYFCSLILVTQTNILNRHEGGNVALPQSQQV